MVDLRDERGRVLLAPAHGGKSLPPLVWVATVKTRAPHGEALRPASSRAGFPYLRLEDDFGQVIAESPVLSDGDECERQLNIIRNSIRTAAVVHTASDGARPRSSWSRLRATRRKRKTFEPGALAELVDVERNAAMQSPPTSTEIGAHFCIRDDGLVALETDAGQTLLLTPKLTSSEACIATVDALRHFVALDEHCERFATTGRGHAYSVRDQGHVLLARSPVYTSQRGRDDALEIVRRLAPSAPVLGRR